MSIRYNFKTNYFFPTPARYLGYAMIAIGIIGIFTKGIETLLISVIGIGISFTQYGVLILPDENKIKEYLEVFWIKTGSWESLDFYQYITVLEITEKSTTYSQSNRQGSTRNLVFRITLLNENHYQKLLLKQLHDKDEAHKEAEELSQFLRIEKVVYSPG